MDALPWLENADVDLLHARDSYRALRGSLRRWEFGYERVGELIRLDRTCGEAHRRIWRANDRLSPNDATRLKRLISSTRAQRRRLVQLAWARAREAHLAIPRDALAEILEALCEVPVPLARGGRWRVAVAITAFFAFNVHGAPLVLSGDGWALAWLIAPLGIFAAGFNRSWAYRSLVTVAFLTALTILVLTYNDHFWLPSLAPLAASVGAGFVGNTQPSSVTSPRARGPDGGNGATPSPLAALRPLILDATTTTGRIVHQAPVVPTASGGSHGQQVAWR